MACQLGLAKALKVWRRSPLDGLGLQVVDFCLVGWAMLVGFCTSGFLGSGQDD